MKKNFPPPSFFSQIGEKAHSVFSDCETAECISSLFEDSTHQLWLCQFKGEKRFLKLCLTSNVERSRFWQATQGLFEFELAESLGRYDAVYKTVSGWSPLKIPDLIHAASCSALDNKDENNRGGGKFKTAFLLTEYLEGQVLSPAQLITPRHLTQIATHLALLHQHVRPYFGALFCEAFEGGRNEVHNSKRWQQNLKRVLTLLNESKSQVVSSHILQKTIGLIDALVVSEFQPIMLDLRWDQFLQLGGGENLALLDLDALVWGPKALELVMLEYLLTQEQAVVFKSVYEQYHVFPELKLERAIYRVLLFQMNALGETDFDKWMASPARF